MLHTITYSAGVTKPHNLEIYEYIF